MDNNKSIVVICGVPIIIGLIIFTLPIYTSIGYPTELFHWALIISSIATVGTVILSVIESPNNT